MATGIRANELLTAADPDYFIVGTAAGAYGKVAYGDIAGAAANAAAAEAAADAAEAAAASVNLPAITSGDARETLRVNAAGTGYETWARAKHLRLYYSQSNFSRTGTFAGTWPKNLFVWNGGVSGATGSAWQSANTSLPTTIRVPMADAAEYAWAHPETDVYVVICASPGVGIRSVVGMTYQWDTGTSGDPGTGCIAFNSATMGSVTSVRYSETDANGWTRFVGGTNLGQSLTTPARVAVAGNPAIYAEFTISSAATDSGTYRSQTVEVTASASWPPADGTSVTVYPATDWLRNIISVECEAAFTALSLTGDDRYFDQVIIWPTSADVNYFDSYFGRDHGLLRTYLATWTDTRTQYVYTLPWPYTAAASAAVVRWWHYIEEIVARDPVSVLVDLSATLQTDWDAANDYIHVDSAADMVRVGKLMFRSAERGGMHLPRSEAGDWTPTATGITNIDSATITGGMYQRIGRYVHFQVRVAVDPTSNGVNSQFALSLPIASNLRNAWDAIGVAASGTQAYVARVSADTTNDRLLVDFFSESTGSYSLWITGAYKLD